MPPTDELQIKAVLDLGSMQANLDRGAASFRQWDAQIAQQLKSAQEQLKGLEATVISLQSQVITLEQKLEHAGSRGGGVFMEARHSIMGAGEEVGIRFPRFITTFLAHLGGVAPVMAAAFSGIAIVGIIQIIPELIGKIREASQAIAGFGESQRKAYESALDENQKLIVEAVHLRDAFIELGTIGKQGPGKIAAEQQVLVEKMQNVAAAMRGQISAQHALEAANAQQLVRTRQLVESHISLASATGLALGVATGGATVVTGLVAKYTALGDVLAKAGVYWGHLTGIIEDNTKAMDRNDRVTQELLSIARKNLEERAKLQADERAEGVKTEIANQTAILDARKNVSSARIAQREQFARLDLAAGKIQLAEEVRQLQAAETAKLNEELRYISARRGLLEREHAATGKDIAPELAKLNADRERTEIEHQTRARAIVAAFESEKRKLETAAELATIQGDLKVGEQRVRVAEDTARRMLEAHRITVAQETAQLETAERDRFSMRQAATQKELDIARRFPEQNKAQIIALQHELEAAETEHQNRLAAIRFEGARREVDLEKGRLEEQISVAESSATRSLNVTLRIDEQKRRLRQITTKQWRDDELAALDTWYGQQVGVVDRLVAFLKAKYGEDSLEYQRALDKKAALDERYSSERQRVQQRDRLIQQQNIDRITGQLNTAVNSWISGQERAGQAFGKLWMGMAQQAETNILKVGEQFLLSLLLQQDAEKKSIFVDAKAAGAHAFRSVMASLPFPANIIVAPIAAAGAFSAVMSFGSFDKGGIAPRDMAAFVHEDEMTLTPDLSRGLQKMIKEGGGGAGRDVHYHDNRTLSAVDQRGMRKLLDEHADDLIEIMITGMRDGKFS